jgi:hypothetical protein
VWIGAEGGTPSLGDVTTCDVLEKVHDDEVRIGADLNPSAILIQ